MRGHSIEVGDELEDFGRTRRVQPSREPDEPGAVDLLAHPPAYFRTEAASRSTTGGVDVDPGEALWSYREAQPRECGLDSRTSKKPIPVARRHPHPGVHEGHLDWHQQSIHPREDHDIRRRRTRVKQVPNVSHDFADLIVDEGDAQRTRCTHGRWSRSDHLGHARRVVRQQIECGRDHRRGTAIVHFERVVDRLGYVLGEAHQPLGGRAREAVNRLVVVTHRKDRQRGAGEQPQQQHVSRCEVLKLINEQDFRAPFGNPAYRRFTKEYFNRQVDLLVKIDGAVFRQMFSIAWEEVGESREIPPVLVLDQRWRLEPQANLTEGVEPRRRRVGVGATRQRHQPRDGVAHVAFANGAKPHATTGEPAGSVQNR